MQATTLYIFSNEYPYGAGEPFLENELKILSGKFDRIIICPLKSGAHKRSLPEKNISVINFFENGWPGKKSIILRNAFLLLSIIVR